MDFFNNDIIEVIFRCLVSFLILFIVTKMLGKRQMSELSLFDYVVGISIGNFASEMAINLESDWLNAMTAIIVFGICAFLVSISTVKSIVFRRFFTGKPSVLILLELYPFSFSDDKTSILYCRGMICDLLFHYDNNTTTIARILVQ